MPNGELVLGGIVPFSAVDYPGKLSAVLFCQGCPWRCRYCHNPHLLPRRAPSSLSWTSVRDWLVRRRGLLDAVVFSGGEPTLQKALGPALIEAKRLGFAAGLHTAGIHPDRLAALLPLLDWVGMDVKAPFDDYPTVTGVPRSGERARESARRIVESGIPHEFRTTVHPALLPGDKMRALGASLAQLGATCYAVQRWRPQGSADPMLAPFSGPVLDSQSRSALEACFPALVVRDA